MSEVTGKQLCNRAKYPFYGEGCYIVEKIIDDENDLEEKMSGKYISYQKEKLEEPRTFKKNRKQKQVDVFAYLLYKYQTKIKDNSTIKINSFLKDKADLKVLLDMNSEKSLACYKWNAKQYIYLNSKDAKKDLVYDLFKVLGDNVNFIISWNNENTGDGYMTENKKSVYIEDKIKEAIKAYNQVIFTGAPGTGKTFAVRKVVKELVGDDEKRYKFVQFHPSYDYSDFVEGLRPVEMKESHNPTFVRLDGTFKKFCRQIVEEGLENAYKKDNTKFEDADISEKEKFLTNLYEKAKKKEYTDDELEAFNRETTYYYFIIDEINRADLSKVFGELMFGLEESYRGIENRFDTQYMNLNTYEIDKDGKAKPIEFDCFKDGFFIPKNLKFIGTMNDIDRSVESFDFALRRRFQWIDMKANEMMLDSLEHMLDKNKVDKNKLESLVERIQKMNDILSDSKYGFGLSEAYHIGPAYFKKYNGTDESLETIFNEKIEPIIREYTRGRSADKVEEFVKKCRNQLLKNQKGQMNGGND